MKQHLFLGPPGTGKTTALLRIVDEAMESGITPNRIAYVSFTRKAAHEAIDRACQKFNFTKSNLPYFRTLHSLAFALIGLGGDGVMNRIHYDRIGRTLGINFSIKNFSLEEGMPMGATKGDRMLQMDNLARVKMISIEEEHRYSDDDEITIQELRQFSETLKQYKNDYGLIDFTGMLEDSISMGKVLDVDLLIIDEGQDLSRLQWQFIKSVFKSCTNIYIAGDDDQSIYRWSGADINTFLSLDGTKEVLGKSHRLPKTVYTLANSIVKRIHRRYEKEWEPKDSDGSIKWCNSIDELDFKDGKTWLLLARNSYMLKQYEEALRERGHFYLFRNSLSMNEDHMQAILGWETLRKGKFVNFKIMKLIYKYMLSGHVKRGYKSLRDVEKDTEFTLQSLKENHGLMTDAPWFDALNAISLPQREYYRSCLKNGERILETPRIHINTIHGVKGGEADNVVLLTDLAYKTYQAYQSDGDDEHRVWYVAVTRTKSNLFLIEPQSNLFYEV